VVSARVLAAACAIMVVMPTLEDVESRALSVQPEPIHVCVFARDEDLRGWLVDELLLMTWLGALELGLASSVADACAHTTDLAIVGLDGLSVDETRLLHEHPAVIAIGTPATELARARVLASRLTSRELKQAIRETLLRDRRC
jgi:hypothetical protein